MTVTPVQAGQTYTLGGTLAVGNAAIAFGSKVSGTNGGLIAATGAGSANYGIVVAAGGYNGAAGGTIADSGVLTNNGRMGVFGGHDTLSANSAGGVLQITGSMTNTAVLKAYGGGLPFYYTQAASGGTIANSGTLTNSGAITVLGGAATAGAANGGGVLLNTGVLNNSGTVTLFGSYAQVVPDSASATLNTTGMLQNTGTIMLTGGQVNGGHGAVFSASGSVTNQGVILAFGGDAQPSTDAIANSGGTISLAAGGVLTNQGSIEIGAGGISYLAGFVSGQSATLTDSGMLTNNAVITLDGSARGPGGMLLVTGGATLTNAGTIGGGGALVNKGFLRSGKTASGATISAATLVNDGTIQVTPSATMAISSAVSADAGSAGVFNIAEKGVLTFSGSVGANEKVSFVGVHNTLALGNAPAFAGTLDAVRGLTTIDFLNQIATSASATGTVLTVGFSSGVTAALSLTAPLAATTTLSLVSDGQGGTDLNFGTKTHSVAKTAAALGGIGLAHGAAAEPFSLSVIHVPLAF